MLYFANPTLNPEVHQLMASGVLGYIDTPRQGQYRALCAGAVWCADNGCFGKRFNEAFWWAWLMQRAAEDIGSCAFATAPDVVGDAAATLERARPWLPKIRELGYRVAFVAQDGQEDLPVPWDEFDVLFIGGTTAWKLGPAARALAAQAKQRGMWVHGGRCNSLKRFRYMEAIGCDSADGTYLIFGPTVNLPKLLGWVSDLRDRPALFRLAGECS